MSKSDAPSPLSRCVSYNLMSMIEHSHLICLLDDWCVFCSKLTHMYFDILGFSASGFYSIQCIIETELTSPPVPCNSGRLDTFRRAFFGPSHRCLKTSVSRNHTCSGIWSLEAHTNSDPPGMNIIASSDCLGLPSLGSSRHHHYILADQRFEAPL